MLAVKCLFLNMEHSLQNILKTLVQIMSVCKFHVSFLSKITVKVRIML
jgi:hypothetical protein